MKSVNIHYAKTHLSRLLEEVAAGEEIVIAKAGKPVARLIASTFEGEPRKPGGWQGKVVMPADFGRTPPEIAAAMHSAEPARGEGRKS